MSNVRKMAYLVLCSAAFALLHLLTAANLRAQEIRVIAEPNQSIRMGRGGYVCDGHLTHTPIDATEEWTYEMVQCTGPMYDSRDYAALQTKLSHDELVRLNTALDQLNATSSATEDSLSRQMTALNGEFRAAIESRFQNLPNDVLMSEAVQNLKKSLLEYVDQRLPKPNPTTSPEHRSTPGRRQPSPASPQP